MAKVNRSVWSAIVFVTCLLAGGFYYHATQHQQAVQQYRLVQWQDLLPDDPLLKNTSPENTNAIDVSKLNDADPLAMEMLKQLREKIDNALPVTALDGESIRIAGYLVPLEYNDAKYIKEFLLVPYYGACIHTPPPPANQIIHVFMNKEPEQRFLQLDAVEVAGELEVRLSDSGMGRSYYQMWADTLTASIPPEPTAP